MEEDPAKPLELSYATKPPRFRDGRFAKWCAKWFQRCPHWLIAILMLAPLWLFYFFGSDHDVLGLRAWHVMETTWFLLTVVVLIAGSVKRLNWRHILVMFLLACVSYCARMVQGHWTLYPPFPISHLTESLLLALLAGAGEWALTHRKSIKSLLWALLMGTAAACIVCMIGEILDGVLGSARIATGRYSYLVTTYSDLVHWPLLAILIWNLVPLGLKLGQKSSRLRWPVAGAAVVSIAVFVLFCTFFVYHFARESLNARGPFVRIWAARVLGTQNNPANRQAMWKALEDADWMQPEDFNELDYRKACIWFLARDDRKGTAARLSEMLRKKPSVRFAGMIAELLGQERRYEAAPILMRYAMIDLLYKDNESCANALVKMEIPQSALMLLHRNGGLTASVSDGRRAQLTQLLGRDVGPAGLDWLALYSNVIDTRPTPLTPEQVGEVNRVFDALEAYWFAYARNIRSGRAKATPAPDWNAADTAALEQEVANYVNEIDAK